MPLPPPREHRFHVEGDPYTVREYTRGGERRIQQTYAMSLSLAGIVPGVLDTLDGQNLHDEALLREMLVQAPEYWWETLPATGSSNGTPSRTLSFERVPLSTFQRVAQEVRAFVQSFQRPDAGGPAPAGADLPPAMETVTAPAGQFRGIAS